MSPGWKRHLRRILAWFACAALLLGSVYVVRTVRAIRREILFEERMATLAGTCWSDSRCFVQVGKSMRFVTDERIHEIVARDAWRWPEGDGEITYQPTAPDGTPIALDGKGNQLVAWSPLIDGQERVVMLNSLAVCMVLEEQIDWQQRRLRWRRRVEDR